MEKCDDGDIKAQKEKSLHFPLVVLYLKVHTRNLYCWLLFSTIAKRE